MEFTVPHWRDRNHRKPIDIERARLQYSVDFDEGRLYWRRHPGMGRRVRVGACAGKMGPHGYWLVPVGRRIILRHRLIWAMATGEQPPSEIDHKNGVSGDDRLCNLRPASRAQNSWNRASLGNKTGFKCVRPAYGGKYVASFRVFGRVVHVGTFDTAEGAYAAYCRAAKKHHGEFARTE